MVHIRQIFIRPQTERHTRIPAELSKFGLGISSCLFTIRALGKQRLQQLFPLLGSTARSHLSDRFGILIGNPCGKLGRFCRNGDFDKIGTRLARDGQGAQKRIDGLMHLRRFFFRKFSDLRTEIRIAEKIQIFHYRFSRRPRAIKANRIDHAHFVAIADVGLIDPHFVEQLHLYLRGGAVEVR